VIVIAVTMGIRACLLAGVLCYLQLAIRMFALSVEVRPRNGWCR